ncbi:MAG: hypothetical protein L6R36_005951 [Xanthoria steineri]|nr:MAG: hypothetical protein L6R36_005951 [Xanthoria steineri]
MSPSKQTIALLVLAACSVLGSPVAKPQMVFAPAYCKVDYTVDEQHKKMDVAGITGDYTVSGGSELNTGSSFAVEVTISVGVDIGIEEVAGVGLSAEVATAEQKATSQGATVPCPDGTWKCALKIFPNILSVSGEKVAAKGSEAYCDDGDHGLGPYTVELPVLGDNKAVESRVEICACKNYPGADDEGSPVEKCDTCP